VTTPPCNADDFVADLLATYKMPLVQVDPLERAVSLPYVAGDDLQGAAAATRHLLELGHRRIAFLMGPLKGNSPTETRLTLPSRPVVRGSTGKPAD